MLWNIEESRPELHLTSQGNNGKTISFSPDGKRFASSLGGRSFIVRDFLGREQFTRERSWPTTFWHHELNQLYVVAGPEVSLYDEKAAVQATARLTDGWIATIVLTANGRTMISLDGDSDIIVHALSAKSWFSNQKPPVVPPQASVVGRYKDLLRIIPAPNESQVHGTFYEAGFRKGITYPEYGWVPAGFYVYTQPNWYVFERSLIGLHHPPQKMPRPLKLPGGESKIWVVMPGAAYCRGAFEDAVAKLPLQVTSIRQTAIYWQHKYPRPENDPKWFGTAVLEVTMDSTMTTEQLLETLISQRFTLSDGVVLGEMEARAANVYSGFQELSFSLNRSALGSELFSTRRRTISMAMMPESSPKPSPMTGISSSRSQPTLLGTVEQIATRKALRQPINGVAIQAEINAGTVRFARLPIKVPKQIAEQNTSKTNSTFEVCTAPPR